jgi:hypothetical protein
MKSIGDVVDIELRQVIDRGGTRADHPYGLFPTLQIRKKIITGWAHESFLYKWTDWSSVPLSSKDELKRACPKHAGDKK